MEIDKSIKSSNDWYRAGLLLQKAAELDLYLNGLNDISLIESNKEVRLYLDDYEFDLTVATNSETVKARACDSDGDEYYLPVTFKNLEDLELWVGELQEEQQ